MLSDTPQVTGIHEQVPADERLKRQEPRTPAARLPAVAWSQPSKNSSDRPAVYVQVNGVIGASKLAGRGILDQTKREQYLGVVIDPPHIQAQATVSMNYR